MPNPKVLIPVVVLVFVVVVIGIYYFLNKENDTNTAELSIEYEKHRSKLKTFETDAGSMAYLDEGEGPVILLVHGVPTSSWLYRKIIPDLTASGLRVIAPDMLGYGASEKPDDPEIYAHEKMGGRLLQLMDHLGIEKWSQVFHDGGGIWTWEMLAQDATKVEQLIMLNTVVYKSGFHPPIRFEEGKIAKKYAEQYSNKMGQKMVINPTFKNGILNKEVINDGMLQGYKVPFRDQSSAALYYFFTRTCNNISDYTTLHQSLDIPLTVIWGAEDNMLVWEDIADQVKNNFDLKEEDIHILDAKHFIQEEQPDVISEIILSTMKLR